MAFLMMNPMYHCDPMTREPHYADRERYFNRYKANDYHYKPDYGLNNTLRTTKTYTENNPFMTPKKYPW